jgi:hypothetical protein
MIFLSLDLPLRLLVKQRCGTFERAATVKHKTNILYIKEDENNIYTWISSINNHRNYSILLDKYSRGVCYKWWSGTH